MSIRQMFPGSIVKPGFNPLAAQTPTLLYNLLSWGNNNSGQLGLGDTTSRSSPNQVGSLTDWLNISGGGYTSLAVKTDGTLWAWGRNASGQLGLGNITYYSSPKQVGALTGWSKVSVNSQRSFAIKTDGTLWAWGANGDGQLGLGNATAYSSPKQVGALTTWLQVVAGAYGTYAIKTDGTLWSWGLSGVVGALGLNNLTAYSSPKQIGALTTWASLADGNGGSINQAAIKTDGTLWAWGFNYYGQLGLGNTTYAYSSPKQVGALTTWSKSSQGTYSTYGITTNGALYSWGQNPYGQLGLGNVTYYSSPKQVGALTTWSKIRGLNQAVGGITTGGALWIWGRNNYGNLGLGNTTNYSSPKQVGSSTTWNTIVGGGAVIAIG